MASKTEHYYIVDGADLEEQVWSECIDSPRTSSWSEVNVSSIATSDYGAMDVKDADDKGGTSESTPSKKKSGDDKGKSGKRSEKKESGKSKAKASKAA